MSGRWALPVASILLLTLPACARDEEAEAAKAARAYCAAVASGQYTVAWGLVTPEWRSYCEEVADALRPSGALPGSIWAPVIEGWRAHFAGADTARASAREIFARCLAERDRNRYRALSLEEPWVEISGDVARAV
ncbi:MAG: hypothetical protein MUE73_20205, partial [Planctomycetes bacterium]|nr:hypothetical protein [Planctomycetota bacterium]